ncbi:MAG: DUF1697 domain-containing protein [Paludibacter sp.]
MTTYISLLRGINVGGHKKIKMDALRHMYSELGFSRVESYIQSGNVIFQSSENNAAKLEKIISDKIMETFGFEVPVLIVTAKELRIALQNNPFLEDPTKNQACMHLTFLSGLVNVEILSGIPPAYYAPDEFRQVGKVIYNYCPNGYGNTKLTPNFFESKLKLVASSRNLRTANELLNMAIKDT